MSFLIYFNIFWDEPETSPLDKFSESQFLKNGRNRPSRFPKSAVYHPQTNDLEKL
ncbi:MAG: hypothetical protein SAJ12_16605 [Jaaginema sp. PMC 1079.18]|nr:hypothetical protein [Jaaginema sp. PMC 1080.18]MEC4852606.1 hypothetical protein [Jaaginema sp. PMC 1079.18]MEC4866180.1 hypothetical protein [Jaaginema sp. PMC 1078.18]